MGLFKWLGSFRKKAAVEVKPIPQDGHWRMPNEYRVRRGALSSDDTYVDEGAFQVPSCHRDEVITVIASNGLGWEHVSVSLGPFSKKCPSWEEMCQIKNLFWGEDVCVIQFHPAKSNYVNRHKGCLHMWRKIGAVIEMPPKFMV